MKSVYVICALLCVTLVLADKVLQKNEALNPTATSLNNSHSTNTIEIASKIETTTPIITSTTTAKGTDTTTTTTTTTPAITTTSTTITPTTIPPHTTPVPSTTTTITTTIPTTTTSKTTSHAPTSPATSTSTASSKTTTAVPPSPKDRQFDGLSFFGGIILTTCLMAIAAFSWKFYRQCKEGNYRTL